MHEAATTYTETEANAASSLNVRLLQLTRIVWYGLAAFVIGMFVVGTVLRYHDLRRVCFEPAEVCLQTLRLRPINLHDVDSPNDALQFHALFYTIEQVSINVLLWGVAGLIFWRRRDSWMALLIAFWLLTLAPPFAGYAAAQRWPWLLAPVRVMELLGIMCTALFLYIFPTGRFPHPWVRWWALACAGSYLLLLVLPAQVLLAPPLLAGVILALQYGVALLTQVYRYQYQSTSTERQQTRWVLWGIGLTAVLLVTNQTWIGFTWTPDTPITSQSYVHLLIFAIAASLIPVTIGIAVLRHQLFDIDILINRTLVWALLTAFVLGVYFLIVGYVGTLLRWQDSPALSLIAIGIITVAFQPLRMWVQLGVNRLMYGQRDEPYAVMTQLGQRLQATLSADAVCQTIVEMTAKALRLPYAALYLHNDGEPSCCAEWISATAQRKVVVADPITLPVTYQGVIVAELRFVPRQRNEAFSATDWVLLNDLARQAGSAIHAVQLTRDLQRSRERIVTAREEERRRLRRDLHDGLGPALAAQTLQLDAALDLLETSPQAAQNVLFRIKLQTQEVVADVRRLVYDLRPPALDELGVGGAISNFADSITTVQCDVHVSDDVPPLPAAVEVAAYRIATEAITNVVNHAHAQTCVVHIQIEDQRWLIIEVYDDGSGLPSTHQIGVGLRSMRERAEELGGTLRIESASGTGTCVCARLPIVDRHGAVNSNGTTKGRSTRQQ